MVIIVDSSEYFNEQCVTFLSSSDEDLDNGTTLHVSKPVTGPTATLWSTLDASSHPAHWNLSGLRDMPNSRHRNRVIMLSSAIPTKEPRRDGFPLLGSKNLSWSDSFRFSGEFTFTNGYWEWLEDALDRNKGALDDAGIYDAVHASMFTYNCHPAVMHSFCEFWCKSTNTLHTGVGELSISLWDIRRLGGLPIDGSFYDEVVPSAMEFDIQGNGALPPSCRFLFAAFDRLRRSNDGIGQVQISDWVNFWFRRPRVYKEPPARLYTKHGAPRPTDNPSGVIKFSQRRTKEDYIPFKELEVNDECIDEVYLAALLSCWLCKFVFPQELDLLRPSVFKVAGMMARGERFSLAVPVLASVYRGLNQIADLDALDKSPTAFPVHYVYAWLGQYFGTQTEATRRGNAKMTDFAGENAAKYFSEANAHDLFFYVRKSRIPSLSLCDNESRTFVDNLKLPKSHAEYFICIRSACLTMRRNDEFIVEPYYPHRFGRQFGYCEDIPKELTRSPPRDSLKNVIQQWSLCMTLNTSSDVVVPQKPLTGVPLVTKEYETWWLKIWKRHTRREKPQLKSVILPKPHDESNKKVVMPKIRLKINDSKKKQDSSSVEKLKKAKETCLPPQPKEVVVVSRRPMIEKPLSPGVITPITNEEICDSASSSRSRSETPVYQPYKRSSSVRVEKSVSKHNTGDSESSIGDRNFRHMFPTRESTLQEIAPVENLPQGFAPKFDGSVLKTSLSLMDIGETLTQPIAPMNLDDNFFDGVPSYDGGLMVI